MTHNEPRAWLLYNIYHAFAAVVSIHNLFYKVIGVLLDDD